MDCLANGIQRIIKLWLSERRCKRKEEASPSLMETGSYGFASAADCKYDFLFQSFKAKEIIATTSNFRDIVMFDGTGHMYRACFKNGLILVKRYSRFHSFVNRDIRISLLMSRHQNVMRLLGCCFDFKEPVLAYDNAAQHRLLDHILFHRKDEVFPWKNRLKIAVDVSNAIVYLHTAFSAPVIHTNLCTKNIVIDRFGVAKLFDFSLCMQLPLGETQFKVDCIVGYTGRLAPEYAIDGVITEKTDVYMFGILLLVLLTGERDFHTDTRLPLVDRVQDAVDNNRLNMILDPDNVLERGKTIENQLNNSAQLALKCTQQKVEDRPNMAEVARELKSIEASS